MSYNRVLRPLTSIALVILAACRPGTVDEPPKLIVLIAVDQFRAGYLDRYDEVFTGGFRRLRDEGRRYDRAIVDHAPTLSYPGHTTLATGAHPRTHGITSNAWLETLPDGERRRVFVVGDTGEQILGHPDQMGLSPRNLRVTGLADWVRAAHPDARAVALSTGPGLALVYGGHALDDQSRNHAYWLSSSQGTFVTSTYFRTSYPEWVREFNADIMPEYHANRVWSNSVPEAYRGLARPDEASYEGDGVHTTFPHSFAAEGGAGDDASPDYDPEEVNTEALYRWFFDTPFADEALFALAKEAVRTLALGKRDVTDFLAMAIKSVDRIGHDYGPRSQEQLDLLVRLDRQLGSLFTFLDETVGAGNYTVALSADHGAPNVAEYELERGRPARRIAESEIRELLDRVERFVGAYGGPEDSLPEAIARELERSDFVARAMTPAELAGGGPADDILRAYRNSYVPGRSTPFPLWTREVLAGQVGDAHPANWGIVVEFIENGQLWTAPSTHLSSYRYDREVPIIFMGKGIRAGVASGTARTIDVAPTLADLAGIAAPPTVDGRVLSFR